MDRRSHSRCTRRHIRDGTLVQYYWYLHAEVRDNFEGVIETVGEIGHTDGQRQLGDLAFVVELMQFLQRGGAHPGSAARHTVSVEDRGFFLVIKERAARIKRQRGN